MKKDIPVRSVTEVGVAVVPDEVAGIWDVYLINQKDVPITHVLVNSHGYGEVDGNAIETAAMRYYYETIAPNTAIKVEIIREELLQITNEYWVSFWHESFMYDRKFVFVKGSIAPINYTKVPIVEEQGVLIL